FSLEQLLPRRNPFLSRYELVFSPLISRFRVRCLSAHIFLSLADPTPADQPFLGCWPERNFCLPTIAAANSASFREQKDKADAHLNVKSRAAKLKNDPEHHRSARVDADLISITGCHRMPRSGRSSRMCRVRRQQL